MPAFGVASEIDQMQRFAGNRALSGLMATVQRQAMPVLGRTAGASELVNRMRANPGTAGDVVQTLEQLARQAPSDRSQPVEVIVPPYAPLTVASYELSLLLSEARSLAVAYPDGAASLSMPETTALVAGDLRGARARLVAISTLLADESVPLQAEDRHRLRAAVAVAESRVLEYEQLRRAGSSRSEAMGAIGFAAGGVVADDATGIGAADDFLLPFLGLAALVALAVTAPPPRELDLDAAWRDAARALDDVAQLGTGIVLAVQGERLAGNTRQLAIHLARLLALGSVGGMPSGEPPKNDDENDHHWWAEIKAFVRNIMQATRGASRRQIMRELLRRGFTEEQVLEIEAKLAEAARTMGEDVPPFLPPP
ncbi:hypothetical protein DMA12_35725 [Amycolatopsis balhimycina DSM 5908]|uniref:Uncharacterized protein n=1 Tax=Amycolatopsis balhimycina DSM 5908 TaxID=1081091 RepID=A0A428W3M6_AMYBA|nr:hypothetical protein [Amycolatopsis balhimycina]RSM37690.1 hypothetical protein DMA12_35725 [Amycolatopsis balhimycina DSM 5908]